MERFEDMTLTELRERFDMLEKFHERMTSRRGQERQWEALAVSYSMRIMKLEKTLRDASGYIMTDNADLKQTMRAKIDRLVPGVTEDI